jgi:Periplasmic copper-binding protein (NosD)
MKRVPVQDVVGRIVMVSLYVVFTWGTTALGQGAGSCLPGPVQEVLDPVSGRFPGNWGPDVVVRVDLAQLIQDALDSVTDTNADGYLIIGVVNNATIELGGHVQQSVVIDAVYPLPFALIACSVTLHDPTPSDSQPTAHIASTADAPAPPSPDGIGNIFVMGLHAADSDVAGWLVEGDGRLLRNVAAMDNATGLWFVGNYNTMHNGSATQNSGVGIRVNGQGNIITDVDAAANGSHGIDVSGDDNHVLRNAVGDRSEGNGGDGIHVSGSGNVVQENDAFANLANGIHVSGGTSANPNVIKRNQVGDIGKGNGGHGLLVSGTGNGMADPVEVEENRAQSNGRDGIKVVGEGHELKKNISGGSAAEDNGACEFTVAAGNLNAGGNTANGVAIADEDSEPFPTKCMGTP